MEILHGPIVYGIGSSKWVWCLCNVISYIGQLWLNFFVIGQSWSVDQDWSIVIGKFWLENCDMAIGIGHLWLINCDWSIEIGHLSLISLKIIKYWGLIYILILIFIHLLKNHVTVNQTKYIYTCLIYVRNRDVYNKFGIG